MLTDAPIDRVYRSKRHLSCRNNQISRLIPFHLHPHKTGRNLRSIRPGSTGESLSIGDSSFGFKRSRRAKTGGSGSVQKSRRKAVHGEERRSVASASLLDKTIGQRPWLIAFSERTLPTDTNADWVHVVSHPYVNLKFAIISSHITRARSNPMGNHAPGL